MFSTTDTRAFLADFNHFNHCQPPKYGLTVRIFHFGIRIRIPSRAFFFCPEKLLFMRFFGVFLSGNKQKLIIPVIKDFIFII